MFKTRNLSCVAAAMLIATGCEPESESAQLTADGGGDAGADARGWEPSGTRRQALGDLCADGSGACATSVVVADLVEYRREERSLVSRAVITADLSALSPGVVSNGTAGLRWGTSRLMVGSRDSEGNVRPYSVHFGITESPLPALINADEVPTGVVLEEALRSEGTHQLELRVTLDVSGDLATFENDIEREGGLVSQLAFSHRVGPNDEGPISIAIPSELIELMVFVGESR